MKKAMKGIAAALILLAWACPSLADGERNLALAWTVNQALALYGPLREGSVIITGSLGPMFPGEPGSYKAVFSGGLGHVAFEVN